MMKITKQNLLTVAGILLVATATPCLTASESISARHTQPAGKTAAPPANPRTTTKEATLGIRSVKVDGYKIIVTTSAGLKINYQIRGVCFSSDRDGLLFFENFDKDLELLKALHANSIRTFRPLAAYKKGTEKVELDYEKTKSMLDKLAAAGISATIGFDSARDIVGGNRDDATNRVFGKALYKEYITAFAEHPAIFAWAFGNEYNYHYADWFGGKKEKWLAILADAAKNAKTLSSRPVAVVHGELPSEKELLEYNKIKGLDFVMLNVYRGASFYGLYKDWETRTKKTKTKMPLILGEFGRSSKRARELDASALQREWIKKLWLEIESHFGGSGVSAGGYLFSLKDEAWKGKSNSGPNIGIENSLGVFTEDRQPKEAAKMLMQLWKQKQ
ncbi:MAG: hypothetical protein LBT53_03595 [Puniceicoccales bacterium]|jgi:hypothetical protein|nr:hypothetical protein [Puniceicoccales bacterium]